MLEGSGSIAKLGAFRTGGDQATLKDWRLDPGDDEHGLRHASVAFLRQHGATFESRAQLWVDAEKQPIEDASVEWPRELSDCRMVTTLRLPPQKACSDERQRWFDEKVTFRPAHSMATHRLFGSVMSARLNVYQTLSELRHRKNGIATENTARMNEIPA